MLNELFINNGDGTFSEKAIELYHSLTRWNKAVENGDLLLEKRFTDSTYKLKFLKILFQ